MFWISEPPYCVLVIRGVKEGISGVDSGGGLPSRVIVLGGYGSNKLSSVELITDGKTVENMPPMLKPR